ncbi:MAG TPA: hypothetical protein VFR81_09425 [Longimicrobium sp.]|nr:hypothetical protein [Longimicrobium sp.]
MRKIAILLAAALLGAGPAAPCSSASAMCSCVPPPSVPRALGEADAVFQGRVIDVRTGREDLRVRIRVARRWKGAGGDTVTVRTARGSPSCGFDFVAGTEYLVYARRARAPETALAVSLCSRTKRAEDARREIRTLHRLAGYRGMQR